MTTFTSEDRKAAERHVCEQCGRVLEIDAVHQCHRKKSLAELANEFEDKYNERMGRSGVRWSGD